MSHTPEAGPSDLYFSVSQLDRFREWEEDDDARLPDLIAILGGYKDTPDTLRGKAFHHALENVLPREGTMDRLLTAEGYTFVFDDDFTLPLLQFQEVKGYKSYSSGGLRVGGRVDAIQGRHVVDHKSATWFDVEGYWAKYQWRYYLDIFSADRFTWYVWEMHESDDDGLWHVTDLHQIEQWRYPELERDCAELAERLLGFARKHLQGVARLALAVHASR